MGAPLVTAPQTEAAHAARLRRGRVSDIPALIALEQHFFPADRISRRSFRRFIGSPRATLLIADVGGHIVGCALVLYRRNSKQARLYTIATATKFQRRGIARRLLGAAEQNAKRKGCWSMRLEVREDDPGAIKLYETAGYRRFGRHARYYNDRIGALRFEKPLRTRTPRPAVKITGCRLARAGESALM
jgi:[ribosomal protein S18]-alanine N-acetyltransferase